MRYFAEKREHNTIRVGYRRVIHAYEGVFRFSDEADFQSLCGRTFKPSKVVWTGWSEKKACPECAKLRLPTLVADVLLDED